ncbi:hypothetical protein [Streptomyces sp. BA2]|uniref:hypothetical protein n=1 Tax=Streptomyces sp. BA2 TaxID=436595 RepID=UPI0013273AB0|nr:hypothetical protein [Streptomyces sp. BA2]MWA12594.1 hypothetical protein [Streptomyces sp. BA2]
MSAPSLVRKQAMRAAARAWRAGSDAMDRMPVQAAARACYAPGGPSVDELEQAIRADRAARTLPHRAAA